jgi:hypothetical protein
VTDAVDRVPVPAAGTDRQRAAGGDVGGVERSGRGDAEQRPLGVELVEEAEEVALVGAPAVVQDQGAARLGRGLANQVTQLRQLDLGPGALARARDRP